MKHPKIVCLDFDGVIHSYTSGWKGPRNIPDAPVPGMLEWIELFILQYCTPPESITSLVEPGEYKLCIYSSRSKYWFAKRAMKKWMVKNGFDARFFDVLSFPTEKPPAHVTIDDRVIRFTGILPSIPEIQAYKPWNK